MNDRKSAYWDAAHPQHREAVAIVQEQLRIRYGGQPAPASDVDSAPVDIHELRRSVGVDVTLPPQLQEHWSAAAESDVLNWAIREGIPGPAMQRVLDFYVDRVVLAGGASEATIEEFRREGRGWGLTERQIETLVAWERAWSGRSR